MSGLGRDPEVSVGHPLMVGAREPRPRDGPRLTETDGDEWAVSRNSNQRPLGSGADPIALACVEVHHVKNKVLPAVTSSVCFHGRT